MENLSVEEIQKSISAPLRNKFIEKMEANPCYSLRALARDIKVSAPYLSQCFNDKKKISLDRAMQLAELLKLGRRQTDKIIKAFALLGIKDESRRQQMVKRRTASDWKKLTESLHDQYSFLHQWYHIPLLDLTTCSNFKPELNWIAKRLGINSLQVRNAVERLVNLGLLEIRGERWIKTDKKLHFPTNKQHRWIAQFHLQMMKKAQEALQLRQTHSEFKQRDITGTTMAIDPSKIEEAKKMVTTFRQQLADFLTDGDTTEVYQLNIQLFSLTQTID